MQTTFKRFSVIAGFAVLLALLIGNGLLTRREVGAQITNQQRLSDSHHIMLELEKTESLLKDGETGQRGFLYSGDPRYLTPYNQARTQIDAHFDELMRLTSGRPHDQSLIVQLRTLKDAKMKEMAETIALYLAGKSDEARSVVLSDYGLQTMDRFRHVIDQVEQDEAAVEPGPGAVLFLGDRAAVLRLMDHVGFHPDGEIAGGRASLHGAPLIILRRVAGWNADVDARPADRLARRQREVGLLQRRHGGLHGQDPGDVGIADDQRHGVMVHWTRRRRIIPAFIDVDSLP